MFAYNAFGSTNELGLTILGDRAVWFNRLFQVYSAAPEGLANMNGTRLIPDWKREIAGLKGPVLDVERSTDSPSILSWTHFHVSGSALVAALKACMVVCMPDSPRNYGTVVAFQGTDAVATDGFRLTWAPSGFTAPVDICIPGHAVKPLLAFLKHSGIVGDTVSGFLSEDHASACFVGGSGAAMAYFFVRLSAVKYPSWRSIVPTKFSATLSPEEVAKLQDEAKLKKQAAKRSEAVQINLGTHVFNAKFVADLPKGCSVQLGATPDDPCLATVGNVRAVLCPIAVHVSSPNTKAG